MRVATEEEIRPELLADYLLCWNNCRRLSDADNLSVRLRIEMSVLLQ